MVKRSTLRGYSAHFGSIWDSYDCLPLLKYAGLLKLKSHLLTLKVCDDLELDDNDLGGILLDRHEPWSRFS